MENRDDKSQQTSSTKPFDTHIPVLTDIRFFAIFHIFLFHLWTVFGSDKPEGFENVQMGLSDTSKMITLFCRGSMCLHCRPY